MQLQIPISDILALNVKRINNVLLGLLVLVFLNRVFEYIDFNPLGSLRI